MAVTREEIIVELKTIAPGFNKGIKSFQKGLDGIEQGFDGMNKKLFTNAVYLKKSLKGLESFRMEFLSVMFGGALIMRTMQNLGRVVIDTFMKISGGATPAGQAITALNAEMTFLRFTIGRVIGEALMPILPYLIMFINWVRDFVNRNPKLTAAILAIVTVFGALLFILGSTVLLLSGMVMIFTGVGATIVTSLFGVVLFIILIGVVIYAVMQIIENWGKNWGETLRWLGIAILALGLLIYLVFGGWVILAVMAAIAAILFLGSWMVSHWEEIKEWLKGVLEAIGGFFKTYFYDKPKEWLEKLKDFFLEIWNWIKEKVSDSIFGKAVKFATGSKGSRQFGGVIPETGMYQLHRGERVIPSGSSNSFGNINITINTTGGVSGRDVERIAETLKNEIKRRS